MGKIVAVNRTVILGLFTAEPLGNTIGGRWEGRGKEAVGPVDSDAVIVEIFGDR